MTKKRAPASRRSPEPRPRRERTPARPTRAERIAAAQRARQRRRRVVRLAVASAIILVVVAVSWVVVANRRAERRTVAQLEAGGCSFDRSTDTDRGQGRNHIGTSPTYRVNPPAGGNHVAAVAAPGEYGSQPPADGQVVHALEHGDVVLWHRPEAPEATLSALRNLADRYRDDVLIVARPGLASEVAATAWHRRLRCPAVEDDTLGLFVRSFRDRGPESQRED